MLLVVVCYLVVLEVQRFKTFNPLMCDTPSTSNPTIPTIPTVSAIIPVIDHDIDKIKSNEALPETELYGLAIIHIYYFYCCDPLYLYLLVEVRVLFAEQQFMFFELYDALCTIHVTTTHFTVGRVVKVVVNSTG